MHRVFFAILFFSSVGLSNDLLSGIRKMLRSEHALRQETYYSIPPEKSVEGFLLDLLAELHARPELFPDLDHWMMEVGTVCHWLGHIAEEKGDFRLARKYHALSLSHYRQTGITSSQKLNGYNAIAHAEGHLCLLKHGTTAAEYAFARVVRAMGEMTAELELPAIPELNDLQMGCVALLTQKP